MQTYVLRNFRSDIRFISSFLSNRRLQVVLDANSSQEYPVTAGVPQGCILGLTLFLLYINDLPGEVICDIAIILLSILSVIRHLICGNNLNWLFNLNLIYETLWTGVRSGSIDLKMDGFVHEEKSSFKMLVLTFSSKLDWGYYIISFGKTASKKIRALFYKVSSEIALYFCKSTICPCMEFYYHIWAGAPSCYLELLHKVQNEYAGPLVLHLLLFLNPWLIVKMWPA